MEEQEKKVIEKQLRVEERFKSGANWFFWIAGLSLINSIIIFSGSQWSFIIGLGATQIIDAVGMEAAAEIGDFAKVVAFLFDVFVAGIFIIFGVFARKRYSWSFITGMVLYALDGLLFMMVGDFLSIGFHAFVLFCIFNGFKANKELAEQGTAAVPGAQ